MFLKLLELTKVIKQYCQEQEETETIIYNSEKGDHRHNHHES